MDCPPQLKMNIFWLIYPVIEDENVYPIFKSILVQPKPRVGYWELMLSTFSLCVQSGNADT